MRQKIKICLTLLLVFIVSRLVQAGNSGLTHRYSFNDGTSRDSAGGADGVLVNRTGGSYYIDGQVVLGNDGSQLSNGANGDFIDLPNGIISENGDQASFEFWLTWQDDAQKTWQEFVSFGASDEGENFSTGGQHSTYIMMTPKANNDQLRCGYRYGPAQNEHFLNAGSLMALYEEVHVAVSWDAQRGRAALFVNGEQVAQNSIHFSLANDLDDVNNWLGRSQWDDPMFSGSYNEVRIYNRALTAADVKANDLAGPNAMPASQPSPPDNAIGVASDAVLSWLPGEILPGGLVGYDIYLGEDVDLVANAGTNDTTGIYRGFFLPGVTQYDPPVDIQLNKDYFWRIDERTHVGTIKGAIWRFGAPKQWEMKQAPLMTPWADDIDPENVLPEYPRPQMVRENWMNLNGIWQYEPGILDDNVPSGRDLSEEILVPFPVESAISGVMEHHDRLWYRKMVTLPENWQGQTILLHVEASDWETEVYVNNHSAGVHRGGYNPFSFDITPYLVAGTEQEIIVRVYDPTTAARGKQTLSPSGIWYTSVTGIWNTIWLEPVNPVYIEDLEMVPDVDGGQLILTVESNTANGNYGIHAVARAAGLIVADVTGAVGDTLNLPIPNARLWSYYDPFLYDLDVELTYNGQVVDRVDSYFGMRKIELKPIDGHQRICLNGDFIFQIGPLDQGYWPDGLYRAPTDEALKWDLDMIKAFGFNMLRKHVKVEPRRWYYWADKMGILVWQDMPSTNSTPSGAQQVQFEAELAEMIRDHRNHPSIIMWVVFNEGWGQYDTVRVTEWTMGLDPYRLVSCASGWTDYEVGHIRDRHSYPSPGAPPVTTTRAMVCGEYGGIGYRIADHLWDQDPWGYTTVSSSDELENLYGSYYSALISLIDDPGLDAGVYTQITDVENEVNGLITYDRKVIKADPEDIALIHQMLYSKLYVAVPTSENEPQTWRYRTNSPWSNWYRSWYNDSNWNSGEGGFGTAGTPGSVVRTEWSSSDIWLRRQFAGPVLTPEEISRLTLWIHHDEGAEIYLNGVPAATVGGYTTGYGPVAISSEAKAAYLSGQINLLAVHCHQTTGGQYIDVGLAYRGCICAPGECLDLTGDDMTSVEDLIVLSQDWLDPYTIVDFDRMSSNWNICR